MVWSGTSGLSSGRICAAMSVSDDVQLRTRDSPAQAACAEYRESAIVSIDVVGYSTMIAVDPNGTVEAIRDYDERIVEKVDSCQGEILGRAGDSWLVEFRAIDDAVRFANLQASLGPDRALPLRVGINFGEVIAYSATIHGSAINIAVRLQGIARPGGITFSAAVRAGLNRD